MGRRYTQSQLERAIEQATAPLLKRIEALEQRVDQLQHENNRLHRENNQLQRENAQLKKNSATSSKPPSSDIVKPPKTTAKGKASGGGKAKRKHGGQPGHDKHERQMFTPDEVDHAYTYEWPDTGELIPLDDWHVVQQVELVDKPFIVTEHRARKYRCPRTGRIVVAPLPEEVTAAGLVGPRLSAWIAYLKGNCRMSYALIHEMLNDVMALHLSTGQLCKVVGKVSDALAPAYGQLLDALPQQDHLGVDETGHKDSGQRMWTWCFLAEDFVVYRIMGSRGSEVLRDTLGEAFAGVLNCDYFSAYRKYEQQIPGWVQFCMAHLIRDVKYLTTLTDRWVRGWAEKLLDAIGKMFRTYHRASKLTAKGFERAMLKARDRILKIGKRPPRGRAEAQALADRFRKHGREYFTFLFRPGAEPTNNLTEQALRFVVLDRKLTQGTRGEKGQRRCERIWSVLQTCRQQQRSAYTFIADAVRAHFMGRTSPLLL